MATAKKTPANPEAGTPAAAPAPKVAAEAAAVKVAAVKVAAVKVAAAKAAVVKAAPAKARVPAKAAAQPAASTGSPSAAAAAATLASPAADLCANLNTQVHGGIAITWEHDAHLYMRRATTLLHYLAATEAALAGPTPDLTVARVRLNALDAAPGATGARRIALARLRLADLTGDAAATIAAAQAIMDAYPADSAEAAFTLGRNLFQTGSYNPARLVLEKLAASDSDPARAQAAWLLAARSAALGGTPQSKEEALILFDKAAGLKGPLSAIATLEKAGHLIDTYQLPEAAAFLGKWLKTLPEDDPLRLPGGLLLGGALYAQGSSNPASLVQALAVYDELLVQVKDQPALLNRLHYLRGTTLELLPDLKDPAKKRETQAFQAFYSVLETTGPPAEWEYFERSGFRALAMLEKAKRWQAAVNIARKIASFNGPRAAEAAARASKIQLEQMMW